VSVRNLNFSMDNKALKTSTCRSSPACHRFIGPSGCGKSDTFAYSQPHLRPLSQPARRSEVLIAKKNILAPDQISTTCAHASAWFFRSQRRFRVDL